MTSASEGAAGIRSTPSDRFRKARDKFLQRQDGTKVSYYDIARGTDLSVTHVCKIFNLQRFPSLRTAVRISAYLGCTVEELIKVLDGP